MTIFVRKALSDSSQETLPLVSTPGSPRVYERPRRPISGAPPLQPDTMVLIEPLLNYCGIVSRRNMPVDVCIPLKVTEDAESKIVGSVSPPHENHHFLVWRKGEGGFDSLDGDSVLFV